MKFRRILVSCAIAAAVLHLGLWAASFTGGCTAANDPTVKGAQATVDADAVAMKALNTKIAALTAQVNQPTTQPSADLAGQLAAVKAQQAVAAQKSAADNLALANDLATFKQNQAQSIKDGITAAIAAAPTIAGAANPSWGVVATGIITVASLGYNAYQKIQASNATANQSATTGKLNSIVGAVQSALPTIAQLVGQATDNQILATDINNVGQVLPVLGLLTHPVATGGAAPIAIPSPALPTASGVIPITTGTVTVNGATVPPKSV